MLIPEMNGIFEFVLENIFASQFNTLKQIEFIFKILV